jgi:hypothetical protein
MVQSLKGKLRVTDPKSLPMAFRVADLCLTHFVYLEAIGAYLSSGGGSRGGVMVLDAGGEPCGAGLEPSWSYRVEDANCDATNKILEVFLDEDGYVKTNWVDVRPIPDHDGWFEQVWAAYRSGAVFTEPEEGRSG